MLGLLSEPVLAQALGCDLQTARGAAANPAGATRGDGCWFRPVGADSARPGSSRGVVLQIFDTAEDMTSGGEAFAAMDSAETPGRRVSVDTCELKLERRL